MGKSRKLNLPLLLVATMSLGSIGLAIGSAQSAHREIELAQEHILLLEARIFADSEEFEVDEPLTLLVDRNRSLGFVRGNSLEKLENAIGEQRSENEQLNKRLEVLNLAQAKNRKDVNDIWHSISRLDSALAFFAMEVREKYEIDADVYYQNALEAAAKAESLEDAVALISVDQWKERIGYGGFAQLIYLSRKEAAERVGEPSQVRKLGPNYYLTWECSDGNVVLEVIGIFYETEGKIQGVSLSIL